MHRRRTDAAGPGRRPAPPVRRARPRRVVPLVANPHVAFARRRARAPGRGIWRQRPPHPGGRRRRRAPPPHELARWTWPPAIEPLGPRRLLPGRTRPAAGLRRHPRLGRRPSSTPLADAAPQADVVLRARRAPATWRASSSAAPRGRCCSAPTIRTASSTPTPSVKLLAQRCSLMTFDLLLAAAPQSAARLQHIARQPGRLRRQLSRQRCCTPGPWSTRPATPRCARPTPTCCAWWQAQLRPGRRAAT